MYAKVINGKIIKYPYTMLDIQNDNPNTSFSLPLDYETMNIFHIMEVEKSQPPEITYKQGVVEVQPTFIGNKLVQTWSVYDLAKNEISQIVKELRYKAYQQKADPLFFKWQRGECSQQEWLNKIEEIKNMYSE